MNDRVDIASRLVAAHIQGDETHLYRTGDYRKNIIKYAIEWADELLKQADEK